MSENVIINAMRQRVSQANLTGKGPTKAQWQQVLEAASRAADHGGLKPWRYVIFEDDARSALGECFWLHAKAEVPELTEDKKPNFINKAYRAPSVLMVYCQYQDNPKAPEIEQIMAVSAATQQVLLGLDALNYGAIWRSGPVAHSDLTKQQLGLTLQDQIVGFLYVGQTTEPRPEPKAVDLSDNLTWYGQ